jgi:hypothetical protein
MAIPRLVKAGFTALAVTVVIGFVNFQSINSQQAQGPGVNSVIKYGGWEVPGLVQSRIVTPRTLMRSKTQEAIPVYVAVLEPEEEAVVDTNLYKLLDGKTIYIVPMKFSITRISQYDVDGRIFCYTVFVVRVFADPESKSQAYGGQSSLTYYDDDGDGRFETLEQGNIRQLNNPRIPKWAQQKN